MSPSIIQMLESKLIFTCLRAEWQLFPDLNPWELSEKVGSKMASRISLMHSCTILSLGGAIVRGLVPPLALGIWILLPGVNLNCSVLRASIVSNIHSFDIPSNVVGLIPGVIFPGLLFSLL